MRALIRTLPTLFFLTCSSLGCGGSEATSADGAPGVDSGGGGGDATGGSDARIGGGDTYRTDLVGRVNLTEYGGGGGYVTGTFADGTDQPAEIEIARAGDCALYEHARPGLCEGTCEGFCTEAGVCEPYARWLDAGTVEVRGLGEPIVLERVAENNFYRHEAGAADLFAPGDVVTVVASGAAFPAFELAARGVADLVDQPALIELHADQPYTLTWTPGTPPARIQLALRVGWHGAPWEAMILCETDDDGSLEIPGTIVGQFPDWGGLGLFQWPSELDRFSRTVLETSAGPIELFVGSRQVVSFTHGE